ncbi:hypothetical protein ABZ646_23790 [Streptomyces sp. NPDC007162]|uniref:hypothetical protein n=1 Tax=Streptomyces sp. NPDC007162 TaxID=3156917 RepID=UPI0033C76DB5
MPVQAQNGGVVGKAAGTDVGHGGREGPHDLARVVVGRAVQQARQVDLLRRPTLWTW